MRHRALEVSILVEQQLSSNLNAETHMSMLTIPIIISGIRIFQALALIILITMLIIIHNFERRLWHC